MALAPGSTLGSNLVLEREIGSGAMGAVWLAENTALRSKVAVKVLQRSLGTDASTLARFQQEARAVASIDSPHVVKIFDFGMTPSSEPYIVMELLRGRDLREIIERDGPLPPERAAHVIRQLCRALGRAHAQGIIHRDIKPANVFVVESDGEPFVKVLDFGIARYLAETNLGMTTTGAVVGTPYYMSPEQFVDPRSIDHRSDLWSVAVVAYGCLLGRLPFLGNTVGALSVAVHQGTYAAPSQVDPRFSPALDAFFQRAFQLSPDQRYQSANELAAAFGAAVGAAPASVEPWLVPTAYASGVPLASAGYLPGPTPQLGPPAAVVAPTPHAFGQISRTQPAPARSSSPLPWLAASLLVLLGIGAAALYLAPSTRDAAERAESGETESAPEPRKKKKKKVEDGEDASAPAASPGGVPEPTATPEPSEPTAPAGPTESPVPTPKPAPTSATTSSPSSPSTPAPIRYAWTGDSCRAYKRSNTCPSIKECCPSSAARDTVQLLPPAPGKDFSSCNCMRPVCGPGENFSSHKCMVK